MVSQGPRSILVRVNEVIYGFLRIVCATLFAVMLVAVSVQVFGRYVLLASTPWAEEVSVYCLIWFVLLGASMAVRDNAHFVSDILPPSLPGVVDKSLAALTNALYLATAVIFIWYGFQYAVLGLGKFSFSMGFPMIYIFMSMPVTGAIMLVFLVERFAVFSRT